MVFSTELMTIDSFRPRSEREADDVGAAEAELRIQAAETRHGATVVIKRRRRRVVDAPAQHTADEAGATDAGRPGSAPKVHLLKSSSSAAVAPASAPQPEPPVKARRKRLDSLRAPRLVAHLVFERPERAAPPVRLADDAGEPFVFSLAGDAQYRAIGRALAQLREVMASARNARRWRPRL